MKLIQYMKEYGIKGSHLKERLGISANTFSSIKNGKQEPTLALAIKIEDETEGMVTCRDLLIEKKDKKKK